MSHQSNVGGCQYVTQIQCRRLSIRHTNPVPCNVMQYNMSTWRTTQCVTQCKLSERGRAIALTISMVAFTLPTTKGKRKTNGIVQTIHLGTRVPGKVIRLEKFLQSKPYHSVSTFYLFYTGISISSPS